MKKLNYQLFTELDEAQAREAVDAFFARDKRLAAIKRKWVVDRLVLQGPWITGHVDLAPGTITIELRLLGFVAMYAPKIEAELAPALANAFLKADG